MAVAGAVFAEPILVAMKTPKDSLQLAITYTRVIFYGLPFSYMYAFVMSVLRGAGDSKTPFKFLLVSVALDIILNPLLIFGLGPLPQARYRGLGICHVLRAGVHAAGAARAPVSHQASAAHRRA